MFKLLSIKISSKIDKKFDAKFINTQTKQERTISFGAKKYRDYTLINDKKSESHDSETTIINIEIETDIKVNKKTNGLQWPVTKLPITPISFKSFESEGK